MIVLNTEDNLFLTKFKYSISYTKTYKSKEYVDDLFLETKIYLQYKFDLFN